MKQEEIKIVANKILEMIYWLYQKDLKLNVTKDKIQSFSKIIKKKDAFKKNEPNLFNY